MQLYYINNNIYSAMKDKVRNVLCLANLVRENMRKKQLLTLYHTLLVTLSGGQDSICSLLLLYLLQKQITTKTAVHSGSSPRSVLLSQRQKVIFSKRSESLLSGAKARLSRSRSTDTLISFCSRTRLTKTNALFKEIKERGVSLTFAKQKLVLEVRALEVKLLLAYKVAEQKNQELYLSNQRQLAGLSNQLRWFFRVVSTQREASESSRWLERPARESWVSAKPFNAKREMGFAKANRVKGRLGKGQASHLRALPREIEGQAVQAPRRTKNSLTTRRLSRSSCFPAFPTSYNSLTTSCLISGSSRARVPGSSGLLARDATFNFKARVVGCSQVLNLFEKCAFFRLINCNPFGLLWCNHFWQRDSFHTMLHVAKVNLCFSSTMCFYLPIEIESVLCEQNAREWRHKSIQRTCVFFNYEFCTQGHTKSDRVETILFNIMRGTGITGLQALQWKKSFYSFSCQRFYPGLSYASRCKLALQKPRSLQDLRFCSAPPLRSTQALYKSAGQVKVCKPLGLVDELSLRKTKLSLAFRLNPVRFTQNPSWFTYPFTFRGMGIGKLRFTELARTKPFLLSCTTRAPRTNKICPPFNSSWLTTKKRVRVWCSCSNSLVFPTSVAGCRRLAFSKFGLPSVTQTSSRARARVLDSSRVRARVPTQLELASRRALEVKPLLASKAGTLALRELEQNNQELLLCASYRWLERPARESWSKAEPSLEGKAFDLVEGGSRSVGFATRSEQNLEYSIDRTYYNQLKLLI